MAEDLSITHCVPIHTNYSKDLAEHCKKTLVMLKSDGKCRKNLMLPDSNCLLKAKCKMCHQQIELERLLILAGFFH